MVLKTVGKPKAPEEQTEFAALTIYPNNPRAQELYIKNANKGALTPEERTEFSKFTSIIAERAKNITEQEEIAERAKWAKKRG